MIELAVQVQDLTNSKSEIKFEPLPEDDPRQRQPDITLAREKLGWEPKVPLREGLEKSIGYFSDLLKTDIIKDAGQ
jgi:UDP-glucuronate decarboxylase